MNTPEQPPFPSLVTFSAEGTLAPDGTLTAHIRRSARGDSEVLYRLGFRNLPPSRWKELVLQISHLSGFDGEVGEASASAPEDTAKAFEFEYDYTREKYSEWTKRRITPPLPAFGIENQDDDQPTAEPIPLGASGEVVYTAKLQLPPGYTPHPLPDNVHATEEFAEYHATYSLEESVLTTVRRLVIKKSAVPPAAWGRYRKFRKAVSDDVNHRIDLDYTTKSGRSMQLNPEADRKMQEGVDSLNRRDITAAQEAFRRVLQIDPDHRGAHGLLGETYLARNDIDSGVEELRKEQELYPRAAMSYKILAPLFTFLHRTDEAIEQWRKLVHLDPENRDAVVNLSKLLLVTHKYSEAVDELEAAVKLTPDSPYLSLLLGDAYLRTDQKEQGLSALRRAVALDSGYETLNRAAYSLAAANVGLEHAKEYAEKAVHDLQAASTGATASDDGALATTTQLAAAWDTLGWVYFRLGDLDRATRYLRASWSVSQSVLSGGHLAQLYQRQGNQLEAVHLCKLALASVGNDKDKDEIRLLYENLTRKKFTDVDLRTNLRRPDGSFAPTPGEELTRMRSVKVDSAATESSSAIFSIVFSPGKVEDIKFVSGSRSLEPMGTQLTAKKLNVEFPEQSSAKLVRRGMLRCGSAGCDFVLLLPNSASAREETGLSAH